MMIIQNEISLVRNEVDLIMARIELLELLSLEIELKDESYLNLVS